MELGFVDSGTTRGFKTNRQRKIKERLTVTDETQLATTNVFLQWCDEVQAICFYLPSTFGFMDRTRLRKRTIAELKMEKLPNIETVPKRIRINKPSNKYT